MSKLFRLIISLLAAPMRRRGRNNTEEQNAYAQSQQEGEGVSQDLIPQTGRRRRVMPIIIGALVAISAIGAISIGILLYYHKQTPTVWVTFGTVTAIVLAICLQWQDGIWKEEESRTAATARSDTEPAADHPAVVGNLVLNKPLVANQIVEVNLILLNGGGTAAKNLTGEVGFVYKSDVGIPEPSQCATGTTFGPITLLAHAQVPILVRGITPLPAAELVEIENGKEWLFFCGKGSYDGIGGKVPIEFCWVYRREIKGFTDCSDLRNLHNRPADEPTRLSDVAFFGVQDAGIDEPFRLGQPARATITFVNSGNTPAYDLHLNVKIHFRTADEPIPPIQPLTAGEKAEGTSIVNAHGRLRHYAVNKSTPLGPKTLEAIQQGTVRLYVWGRVEYKDILKRERWTNFCLVQNPKNPLLLDNCGTNNEAN